MRDRRFCCAYCQVRLYPFRREMDGLLLCRVLRLSSRNIASLPVVTDSIVLSLNGLTNSIVFLLVGFSLSWGAAIVVLLDPFRFRSEIIDWTEGRVSSLYFWIRLCDWSEAIHDFAIRAKSYRFWSFLVVVGPLCFVLCALCFVFCALCFVLCAL